MYSDIEVSFIIPVYNVEEYIEQCISSVCNISSKEIEIIIINDGSTDNSTRICEKYAKADKRIILINQRNQGVSAARNVGIKHAKGEWICFVDSDDWLSEYFEQDILSELDSSDDIVYFGIKKIVHKKREHLFFSQDIMKDIDPYVIRRIRYGLLNYDDKLFQDIRQSQFDYYAPWGKIYKRKIIEENEINFPTSTSWGEDLIFNFNLLKYVKKGKYIGKQGYFYRINDSSISLRYSKNIMNLYLNMISELNTLIESENDKIIREKFYLLIIRQFLFTMQRSVFHPDNHQKFKERKNYILKLCENELVKSSLNKADLLQLRPTVMFAALLLKYKKIMGLSILYKFKHIFNKILIK